MQGTNPIYAGGMGTTDAVSVGKAYIKFLQAVRAQQTLCSARHMPDSRACMRYIWAQQMQANHPRAGDGMGTPNARHWE
jgi:hypothetical protein